MEDSGKIVCDRTAIGDWEKWCLEYTGEVEEGYARLKSHHGLYLALSSEGALEAAEEPGESSTWGLYYAADEEEFNSTQ